MKISVDGYLSFERTASPSHTHKSTHFKPKAIDNTVIEINLALARTDTLLFYNSTWQTKVVLHSTHSSNVFYSPDSQGYLGIKASISCGKVVMEAK